jgi:3-oxoacyl-[acyl-carrier protein] reductase
MAAYGGIDVLVNNAGIMKLARLEDGDEALIDSQIAINLRGTINTLREAAKRLRDGGRIVNFSTSVIGLKLETYGIYAATKSAVETLTGILSKELRGRSITVNAVAPGPDCDRPFPRWQVAGPDRAHVQDEPARTARYARGHCRGGRLPRRA